uniref:Uncharacterized protein n=1 Tax=Anas platyrhynchos TaxID=8839 RepID=A0A8B9TMK8_ANAPL
SLQALFLSLFKAGGKTLKDNDINALNSSRETLLHVAAANGHLAVMEYLISRGAKPDVKDKKGRTPLHRAAEKGHGDAVKVLLQVRRFHVQLGYRRQDAASCGRAEQPLVILLVNAGAKVNAVTKELVTPLHVASQRGNTDVAQQLLQHKASVNAKDRQAKSPLHYASEKGDETMVEMLLDANADPNAQDKEKRTPLHAAAEGGHLGVVRVLLATKGRLGVKDMHGCTPLHYNIDDRNIWRKTALHIAAEYGHGDLINLLLSYGAAINALDNSKDTPLHCACKAGHLNAVISLINWSQGEKANLLAANSLKKTPLQVAESNRTENQAQIVALLKKKMLITR